MEASGPVDVFVCRSSQVPQITSVPDATRLNIYSLAGQAKLDNLILTLPPEWKTPAVGLRAGVAGAGPAVGVGTWDLVFGNASANHVAVYYTVHNAQ